MREKGQPLTPNSDSVSTQQHQSTVTPMRQEQIGIEIQKRSAACQDNVDNASHTTGDTTTPRVHANRARPNTTGRKRRLSVICPCYNEADSIEAFYAVLKRVLNRLTDYVHRIVLVDDGSADGTLEALNELAGRDPCVEVYSLTRNFGQQAALTAGLEHARGDVFVLMDADLQHPPEVIPKMLRAWEEGSAVVLTVRRHTADATWWKQLSSQAFYAFFNAFSTTRVVAGAADFCLLSRPARDALVAMPESHRFLRGMVAWMGFPHAKIDYHAQPRVAGDSKYSQVRMLRLAADAIFSFSTKPLRLATQLGLWIVAGGMAYLAYVLYLCFFSSEVVHGWSSITSLVLVLGGFQLISIGLIGEYLARVFEQVKARPAYLLKQQPRRRYRKPGSRPRRARKKLPLASPSATLSSSAAASRNVNAKAADERIETNHAVNPPGPKPPKFDRNPPPSAAMPPTAPPQLSF